MRVDLQVSDEFRLPNGAAVRAQADAVDTAAMLALGTGEEPPGSRAAVALALYRDRSISTDELKAAAERRLAGRMPQLHTFVPLYTTNHCDSECKMCGMRKGNERLVRKFAGKNVLEEQLEILYHEEGVRGVGLLTGEYEDKYTRMCTAFRVGWVIRRALQIGFRRIYFNIGSMEPDEIEVLGEWIERDDPVTMCVFQETYDRGSYRRFMGNTGIGVPKADYDRRVVSFDRWLDAGYRYVNPGVLIGLHEDLETELINLVAHAEHLRRRGAVVDLSVPRMRPAQSTSNKARVDDEDYLRLMAAVAFVCPDQRLVLTTREGEQFQDRAIGLAGVISPGSPDVAPYRKDSVACNSEDSSQFLIADRRRPREVLGRIVASGRKIDFFEQRPAVLSVG